MCCQLYAISQACEDLEAYQFTIDLSAAVDVYGEWVDAAGNIIWRYQESN